MEFHSACYMHTKGSHQGPIGKKPPMDLGGSSYSPHRPKNAHGDRTLRPRLSALCGLWVVGCGQFFLYSCTIAIYALLSYLIILFFPLPYER